MTFLPVCREDMAQRDWHYIDFLLVSGDAYVDHPSFAAALIGRWLEHLGFRVGIIAQPDVTDPDAIRALGRPRYAILISPGNLDSMLNLYTAAKKPRRQDAYSPGGKAGRRPERAAVVYSRMAKEAFPEVPVIVGGIEASLRRFVHYDFWQDKLLPSVLEDSGADLLVYGMGEKPLGQIARALAKGKKIGDCQNIPGTCYLTEQQPPVDAVEIPGLERCLAQRKAFARAFATAEQEQNHYDGKVLWQKQSQRYLVQNPPAAPLTTHEMDEIYGLPFERAWHPMYDAYGGVPALAEVEFSITSHRGCFGGCAFCAICFHQGRVIQSRSDESLLAEAKLLTEKPNFKGYIHDVGGPTANFRNQGCRRAREFGPCRNKSCLWPEPCKQLKADHSSYGKLLADMAALPKVKKVFVRSGLRYDYLLLEPNHRFLEQLCRNHISGQLKVAPEHCSPGVLAAMGKPDWKTYERFASRYQKINQRLEKKQYLVPYLIAAHPGSRLKDALDLAIAMKKGGWQPEQVQLFIPTPGSRSTCMYYSGYDPRTLEPIYVARTEQERYAQRALLQFADPKNWPTVRKALLDLGRADLIGKGKDCLVPRGETPGYSKEPSEAPKATGDKGPQKGKKPNGVKSSNSKPKRNTPKSRKGAVVTVGNKYRSTGEQNKAWYEQKGFKGKRK